LEKGPVRRYDKGMKRVLSACLALSLGAVLAGCGGPAAIPGPDGKVTVKDGEGNTYTTDTKSNEVTLEGTDSTGAKTTVTTGSAVDLSPFGLEPYPGAEVRNDLSTSGTTTADGGTQMASVIMTTSDSFDQVTAFYKGKLKKVDLESKAPESALLVGVTNNDSRVNVNMGKDGDKTQITLIATKKP
jgi:predicted small lipoprotein YifL